MRTISSDEYFLGAVAADVANENVPPPTCFAMVANISGPITGPISVERHHRIDKTNPVNLSSLPRFGNLISFLVEKLEVTICRLDVVIIRVFTPTSLLNIDCLYKAGCVEFSYPFECHA